MKKKINIKDNLTPEKMSLLLINDKKTFADIGRMYKTSRQRIHQIYNEYSKEEKYCKLFENYKRIPSKEELELKFEKHCTYSELCEEYNISFLKLKKILKGYNLSKKFINEQLTREKLIDLFINKNMTDKQISKLYDCSENTVKKLRQDNEVIKKDRKNNK